MIPLRPEVRELVLDPFRSRRSVFRKKMHREFENNPAGRIWFVNTKTKVRTNVSDRCIDNSPPVPRGLHVFAPLAPRHIRSEVVSELRALFRQEEERPTVPHYRMSPYTGMSMLFVSERPQDKQMPMSEVLRVLYDRAPVTAGLYRRFIDGVRRLLGVSDWVMDTEAKVGILRYEPRAGLHAHIDNIARMNNSVGPIFTMGLGGDGPKLFDLFPVLYGDQPMLRLSVPEGGIIMLDGPARLEWSHAVPEGDPHERWTFMIKFGQITARRVGFCQPLRMDVPESVLNYTRDERGGGKRHRRF